MNEDLKKVIETSRLILHEGSFIIAKVKTAPPLEEHFLISKDNDEITVITKKENSIELEMIEQSQTERVLFEVNFGSDTPHVVGFLALVCSKLAEGGMSLAVVSTYSKDYILVHKTDSEKAVQAFRELGFSI